MSDPINPSHYRYDKFEAIDVIEEAVSRSRDPVSGYLQAQTLKYLLRVWNKENPIQDLKKSRWYLDRLISKLGQ